MSLLVQSEEAQEWMLGMGRSLWQWVAELFASCICWPTAYGSWQDSHSTSRDGCFWLNEEAFTKEAVRRSTTLFESQMRQPKTHRGERPMVDSKTSESDTEGAKTT